MKKFTLIVIGILSVSTLVITGCGDAPKPTLSDNVEEIRIEEIRVEEIRIEEIHCE